jgi:precorrin-6B methylase 2
VIAYSAAVARAPDFDLAKTLASPSFTPGQRDAPALVELVVGGEEPTAPRAAAALAKLGEAGRRAIEARLLGGGSIGGGRAQLGDQGRSTTDAVLAGDALPAGDTAELGDAATARLVGALGLFARAGDATARAELIARTRDAHVRVRRAAIAALGKLARTPPRTDAATSPAASRTDPAELADVRAALIARWDAADIPADERRTLAEALGKLGGDELEQRLKSLDAGHDAELERRRDRALLMASRDSKREAESSIAIDVAPPSPLVVRLRCRAGLAPMLRDELAALRWKPTARRDDAVDVTLDAPLGALHASRLWTTASIRVELPPARGDGEDIGDRITRTLLSPAVRELFARWTRGPIRWRLGFPEGHKRSIVWRVAKMVTTQAPELVNDPTQTTWDVLVDDDAAHLDIVPRRAPDPRFVWRVAEVPAASHPTVAAALAFVAGARDGDRVWDPFVGSGAELVERARLGPCASLTGSDLDEAALAAARQNLDAAGVTATLVHADARTHPAGPVDLIITNPPLGSRVQLDAKALLVDALPHFVKQLAPGGRLVWITPASKHTTPVIERLGLHRVQHIPVDLGGVRGSLERWDKARR